MKNCKIYFKTIPPSAVYLYYNTHICTGIKQIYVYNCMMQRKRKKYRYLLPIALIPPITNVLYF